MARESQKPPPRRVRVAKKQAKPSPRRRVRRSPRRPSLAPLRRLKTPNIGSTPPNVALAVCGAVVGLLVVAATALIMAIFDWTRGTSSGGGWWGLLGIVVVIALAIAAGTFMLDSTEVAQARLTSTLGALLVLIVVLAFLLDVVFTTWAWIVIPVLSALSYLVTHAVVSRTTD